MRLEHSFVVPVTPADAWKVLLDIEQIVPCMPGATLLSMDGDRFTGKVKIKIGPITVSYKGSAEFVERDDAGLRAAIRATAREERGAGTAAAMVTAQLCDHDGASTRVDVVTDLDITGKPAQFGRGVIEEVGGKIIDQFAERLSRQMQDGTPTGPATTPDARPPSAPTLSSTPKGQDGQIQNEAPKPSVSATTELRTSADDARPFGRAQTVTEGDDALDFGLLAYGPLVKRAGPFALALLSFMAVAVVVLRRKPVSPVTVVLAHPSAWGP